MAVREFRHYDVQPCIRIMQAAKQGCSWYRYSTMDGPGFVEEHEGEIRGYVRYWLGRPETHIRQLIVAPQYHNTGTIAFKLLAEVVRCAAQYGSQGVEGFQHTNNLVMVEAMKAIGASLSPGHRSRFPLVNGINPVAQRWLERCLKGIE